MDGGHLYGAPQAPEALHVGHGLGERPEQMAVILKCETMETSAQ